MKNVLRRMVQKMSSWPIIGRIILIGVAIIRLPHFRKQVSSQMIEVELKLQQHVVAQLALTARIERLEVFIGTQMPKMAQTLAELNQKHQLHENVDVKS